jgi:hypothetical protein
MSHLKKQPPRASLMASAVLLCLAFGPGAPLAAKDGRDFAGSYDLTNVEQQGGTYQFTFRVRVFNYSDGEVTNATLFLQDSVQPGKTYAVFAGISLADRESVTLKRSITVPQREFESWRRGLPPRLEAQYRDAEGKSVRRKVELVRMPLGREEE